MPVVKIYDISTVDEVKEIEKNVKKTQENRKYDEYTKNNIMLVRTTKVFPEDRVIKPLSNVSYIAKSGANFIYQSKYYDLDLDELKKLETYELCYRSTVHCTENGLVSSHMYGNFDNRDFIIMDPLNEHLGKSNIRNFAGQDLFIKGNMQLSDKAIIIIRADKYEVIKQTYPEVEKYNVVLYNGIPKEAKEQYLADQNNDLAIFDVNDERAIVEQVLLDLGYTPELIGSHYIINSPTSEKIVDVNSKLASEYGVLANGKHNFSDEYQDDFNKNMQITNIFNRQLIEFIFKLHNIDVNSLPENGFDYNHFGKQLYDYLGIDVLAKDIEAFNSTIEKLNENGLLPTSGELLENNTLDIYAAYVKMTNVDDSPKLN